MGGKEGVGWKEGVGGREGREGWRKRGEGGMEMGEGARGWRERGKGGMEGARGGWGGGGMEGDGGGRGENEGEWKANEGSKVHSSTTFPAPKRKLDIHSSIFIINHLELT